jgi:addiction module HigA family antidote
MMMKTPANRWTPHWAIHPGEHLRECIESNGLTTEEFARRIEVPIAIVDAIIAGQHPITLDMAACIDRTLGIMPELWFVLQLRWQRYQESFQASA